MSREIKFRMWLPGIKKMTYSHTIEELMNWGTKEWTNGTAEFLQYTGLKDVNGKEVYEGDVLLDFFTGDYYEVVWDDSGAMFLFSNTNVDKSKKTGAIDYYEFEDECRGLGFAVAGNVHEHPDLGRTAIVPTEQA